MFIGLFADFIANDKPIFCKYQGETYFPVLKSYSVDLGFGKWPPALTIVNWKDLKYDFVIWPPIPYSPTEMDKKNKKQLFLNPALGFNGNDGFMLGINLHNKFN